MTLPPLCLSAWLLLLFGAMAASALSSNSATPIKRVAVIGATGNVGRQVTQQLVDQGIQCNLLLRKVPSTKAPGSVTAQSSKEEVTAYLASLPGVQVVQGDVGNVEALETLVQDCDACLAVYGATRRSKLSDLWHSDIADTDPTHAKQINYQGVANLLQALKTAPSSCRRLVRITGKGEEPNSIFSILINMLGSMAKAWNYEGERLLRDQTDVDYTVIRPGVMSADAPSGSLALADDGGDLKVAPIAHAAIAALCIQCLSYPNAARSTLTAMTVPEGEGAASWAPLLEKVQPDRREFPTDMLEQHRAAVRGAVLKLGVVAALVAAVAVQLFVKLVFG